MNVPADLKYSEDHMWIRLDGRTARLGITDFAQNELGDIVFVELPEAGAELKAGEPFGSVESVKSVTELYSPVSGKVTQVNAGLMELPGRVNLDPYTNWMAVIELTDPSEAERLWSAEAYAETYGAGQDAEE